MISTCCLYRCCNLQTTRHHKSMLPAISVCKCTGQAVVPAGRQTQSAGDGPHLPEGVQEQEDAVVLLQDVPGDGIHGLAREDACQHVHRIYSQRWPRHLPHSSPRSATCHSKAPREYVMLCCNGWQFYPETEEDVERAHLQAGCQALALRHNALDLRQHLLARLQQPLPLVRTQRQVRLRGTDIHFMPLRSQSP